MSLRGEDPRYIADLGVGRLGVARWSRVGGIGVVGSRRRGYR